MRRFAIWPALFALFFALAAPSLSTQTTPAKKSAKPEEKAPFSLTREIRHQIRILPFYSVFDSIAFALNGNIVTLTGQVLRPTLKEHAEAAVKSIEGVSGVVNRIEVLPVSSADNDLRRAVYRALFEDSTLARYAVPAIPSIHIIVKDASVTLEGSVTSASDKELAGLRASGVANVLSAKNNLVVQPSGSAAE
jgi:hyperosmotically inducible protein